MVLSDAGFTCEKCGREGPTRRADYTEVRGRVLYLWFRSVRGRLCGQCSRDLFSEFTPVTALQGWFGFKSFLLTLVALPTNTISRMLAPPPLGPDAAPPELTCSILRLLEPEPPAMAARLGRGEKPVAVVNSVASGSEATPAEVALYLVALAGAATGSRVDPAT